MYNTHLEINNDEETANQEIYTPTFLKEIPDNTAKPILSFLTLISFIIVITLHTIMFYNFDKTHSNMISSEKNRILILGMFFLTNIILLIDTYGRYTFMKKYKVEMARIMVYFKNGLLDTTGVTYTITNHIMVNSVIFLNLLFNVFVSITINLDLESGHIYVFVLIIGGIIVLLTFMCFIIWAKFMKFLVTLSIGVTDISVI